MSRRPTLFIISKILMFTLSTLFTFGCAFLHHAQVGQIDNRDSSKSTKFDIKVSEMGVSTEEIGKLARATKSADGDKLGNIAEIVAMFQMGPKTGAPVYNPGYAEKLILEIYKRCPTGKVTGLMSIRETRKYPVISGEIVKITGYCIETENSKMTQAPKVETKGDI